MKKSVYELVTEAIIAKLEAGVVPWVRPWKNGKQAGGARNWNTGKLYRGVNQLLLDWSGEWATYNQVEAAGGNVKLGAKSSIVIFFNKVEKENEDGDIEKIPVYKQFRVFNIETQCEGLTSKIQPIEEEEEEGEELDPIQAAEAIAAGFVGGPELRFASGRAYYEPFFDRVSVPPLSDYRCAEEYYCTLFHELVHSTGHESRLKREKGKVFGDKAYSKEELIAEVGAAMLCGVAGIEHVTLDNSAAYLKSWISALRGDSRLIVTASSAAQKAADLILGTQVEYTQGNEVKAS
ncbi:ArdC family protein [Paenibacillus pasadenensis]|uniref:ArdC family protein n=1 Tax=Paenibacillus pasadenensis TaxID=217090 RepID=UPI000C7C38E1|nr:zincin-like metallopeptidase domain-containing protein [Paenibacillus pasadenensis]